MSENPVQSSPELRLFFERLLEIKKFVKESAEKSKDATLFEIYEKLEGVIKEGDHD